MRNSGDENTNRAKTDHWFSVNIVIAIVAVSSIGSTAIIQNTHAQVDCNANPNDPSCQQSSGGAQDSSNSGSSSSDNSGSSNSGSSSSDNSGSSSSQPSCSNGWQLQGNSCVCPTDGYHQDQNDNCVKDGPSQTLGKAAFCGLLSQVPIVGQSVGSKCSSTIK